MIVFGEALLPGYPFWLSYTHGSKFESSFQKELHAHYLDQGIQIEGADLKEVQKIASEKNLAVYLGTMERAPDRGGHSLYCSLVYINQKGEIGSVHRKLQPTYEERLCWAPGDGHGLQVHDLKEFKIGGLNCWENWMPLSRTALYAQGENIHVAVWPGSKRNTEDITPFIAKESRSFVLSVSSYMRKEDIPKDIPHYNELYEQAPDILADGGSCLAGPDGKWLIEPQVGSEGLFYANLELKKVYEERQNFDPVGHYSRPDVTQLKVNRDRPSLLED